MSPTKMQFTYVFAILINKILQNYNTSRSRNNDQKKNGKVGRQSISPPG